MNPEDLKHALAGPIASIPTFFTRDGSQDLDSVRQTVEFAVTHRIDRLLLTAGDSNYDLQSEAEMRRRPGLLEMRWPFACVRHKLLRKQCACLKNCKEFGAIYKDL